MGDVPQICRVGHFVSPLRITPSFNTSAHLQLRRYNLQYHWDTKQILDRKRCSPCRPIDRWFNVKDVGVNSVYAAGWSVLQQLALAVNDTATASLCAVEAATSARAILSKMFVPALNGFRSLYIDWDGEEKISTPNVIQNLFPLLLPSLPQELIANLVDEVPALCFNCAHIHDMHRFAAAANSIVPSLCPLLHWMTPSFAPPSTLTSCGEVPCGVSPTGW